MTKKFLTAVGLVFATIIIIICCATIPFKKFELAGGATVKLYLGGKCVYEEIDSSVNYEGKRIYNNDYDYTPEMCLKTTTYTIVRTGKYKMKDKTYTLIFNTEKITRDVNKNYDTSLLLTNAQSFDSSSNLNYSYAQSIYTYLDIDFNLNSVILNTTGHELEIEINDNGQLTKHVKKYPGEWYIPVTSDTPNMYDEYLYFYDYNGNFDHYDVSTNNSINSDSVKTYYSYNKYGDRISLNPLDKTTYEYEYYDDGTMKTYARFYLNGLKEKNEYYPDGTLASIYINNNDTSYRYEHDREARQIKRTDYNKFGVHSVVIYEYNEDGTLKSVSKGNPTINIDYKVVNYTYNIKKYLNGNVKLAEMYVDGVIKSHKEYYRSGATKAELIYENGVLQSKKTYNKNKGTGATYTYTDGQLTYVSLIERDSDGLSITKSGHNEDSILKITKYNPVISKTVQTQTRNSPDEEFTVTDNCETTYDWNTKTTTITFFNTSRKDYPTDVYILDENSNIISADSYEYDNEVGTLLLERFHVEATDEDTVMFEYYGRDNKLEHRLYFHVTGNDIIIEPEFITQETND